MRAAKSIIRQSASCNALNSRNSWEPDASSGYLYNAVHRHYYEPKTSMYYGGDPPAWTLKPPIPAEALYSDGSGHDQGEILVFLRLKIACVLAWTRRRAAAHLVVPAAAKIFVPAAGCCRAAMPVCTETAKHVHRSGEEPLLLYWKLNVMPSQFE